MMLFKTLILTGFMILSADIAFACCETLHVFDVQGVAPTDVLNIRAYPNPKARKIGAIPGGSKHWVTMVESAAVTQFECLKRPNYDHQLFDAMSKLSDFESSPLYQKIRKDMIGVPKTGVTGQTWCLITHGKVSGWVNGKFLKHRCEFWLPRTGFKLNDERPCS